jgi:diguanylate cyclase (GGDEF)-like protein
MNYQLTPDLATLAILLTILYFLRRRHPQEGVGLWLIGLLCIFVEAIAHAFYVPNGPWHVTSHTVALDAYLAAGAIFLWAAGRNLHSRTPTLLYILINTAPLAAVLTTYGLDVRSQGIFHVFIACGLLVGVISPFVLARTWHLGRGWRLVLGQILTWVPMWFAISYNLYRDAAYFGLFFLYLSIAVVFQLSLPRKSLGKYAIVGGFFVWSLVFLLHSWVSNHPQYTDVASQIWDMLKFLVIIGMILVMLEQQVSTNEWYAFHDQLTGLPNRRLFEERLVTALLQSQRNQTRTALFMVDLNGFKHINDTLGHGIGDQVLQHISRNLRSAIRTPDTLARLGGDEFIIITTDISSDLPADVIVDRTLNRISQAIKKPFTVDEHTLTVSGSIGVALYPDDTTDEILLRRLADHRMYQQKKREQKKHETSANATPGNLSIA